MFYYLYYSCCPFLPRAARVTWEVMRSLLCAMGNCGPLTRMAQMRSRRFPAPIPLLGMHGHQTIIFLYSAHSIVTSLRVPRANTSSPTQLQECQETCRPHSILSALME